MTDERSKLKIVGEDGKVWLLLDKSTGVPELEATHPLMATSDAHKIDDYYNDLRYKKPLLNSELQSNLNRTSQILLETSKLMHYYGENVQSHVQWVRKGIEVFDKMEKALDRLNHASKVPKVQMTLNQFRGSQ